jgi:putative inorganic carbon (HCO3(-)) transporter
MTNISGIRSEIPAVLLWLALTVGVGIAVGYLAGGMPNPILVFVGIAGLLGVFLVFRNIEWGLVGLAFISYTMISEVLVDSHGLPSISKAILLLLVLILFARWILRGETPGGAGFALLLIIGYGITTSLSLFYAVDIDRATQGLSDYIKDAAVVVIIVLILKRGDTLRHVTYSVLAGGIFLGAISAYQYLTGTFDNDYWGFGKAGIEDIVGELNDYRIGGPVGDPNFYGQLLLYVVPLAVERVQHERSIFWRMFAACALALSLLSIAFTFSRGTFLGAGIVLLAMMIRNPPRPAVIVTIFGAGIATLMFLMPQYLERMYTMVLTALHIGNDIRAVQDTAIEGRLGEMRVALAVFLDHPLFGVGVGNYEHYFQQYSLALALPQRGLDRAAHSLYMELAAERGVVGLTAYFVLIWYIVRTIMSSVRELRAAASPYSDIAAAYGFSLLGFLVTSTFLHDKGGRFFWVLMGICLSLPAIAASEKRRVSTVQQEESRATREYRVEVIPAGTPSGNSP